MVNINIEDCAKQTENHFELTLVAARRARQISNGSPVEFDSNISKKDKPGIVALYEIAHGKIDLNEIKEEMIKSFRRVSEIEEMESFEEEIEFDAFEEQKTVSAPATQEELQEDELNIVDSIDEEESLEEDK